MTDNSFMCSVNQRLYEISKTLKGDLYFDNKMKEKCDKLNCMVLNTFHVLKIEIRSFECNSKIGRELDSILKARLVNKVI